mgnify:CR=1 FL=1
MIRIALIGSALAFGALPGVAHAEPVLLVSIDGLRPADVIDADKRGLKIPNLRRFIKDGSYASGVVGVLPTVTYPSHATLLTGTAPARSGIYSNTTFDPQQINQGGWYWYASDYKAKTLWDAAAKAGLSTANVHWPVSVGERSIRWSIPQIWRSGNSDDAKLIRSLATPGLIEGLESSLGDYAAGIDESIAADENRGRFAAALIAQNKPDFATVYLTALDHEQHVVGPDTPQAHAILERIDAILGRLIAAETAAHPDAVIAVVSDHGFARTDTEVNLYRAFIDEGLITLGKDGKIESWLATPWNSGGSSAIVLARPEDPALQARVRALLDRLKADPKTHIAEIASADGIKAMGGNPEASFYVNFELGTYAGGFKGADVPLIGPSVSKDMHGYFPASPAMRSTFMAMGGAIRKNNNLGEIDMRAIAPTLAKILGVTLPDAEGKALQDIAK